MIERFIIFCGFLSNFLIQALKWILIIGIPMAAIILFIIFFKDIVAAIKKCLSRAKGESHIVFLTESHYRDPYFSKNPDWTYIDISRQRNNMDWHVKDYCKGKIEKNVGEDVLAYACMKSISCAAASDKARKADMCGYGALFIKFLSAFKAGKSEYNPSFSSKYSVSGDKYVTLAGQGSFSAMKECISSLKEEYDQHVAGAFFAGEEVKRIVGVTDLYAWLKSAGSKELPLIVDEICDRAEEVLRNGQADEAASLVLAAYSLILSAYTEERRYTAYAGLIRNMLSELKKKGLITKEIFEHRSAMVDALDRSKGEITGSAVTNALVSIRTDAGYAFSGFIPKEVHTTTIRDVKNTPEEKPVTIIKKEPEIINDNSPKGRLLQLLAKTEEDLRSGDYSSAIVNGNDFLQVILNEYAQAAGLDRNGLGLTEQIDYFRENSLLEEVECLHLHAIRSVSDRDTQNGDSPAKDECEELLRHMKAEIKLFGID